MNSYRTILTAGAISLLLLASFLMAFTVIPKIASLLDAEEATSRYVNYYWYDMFNHPIEEWYDWRAEVSNQEFRLTDEYPYLYLWDGAPPGNVWVYTFMRLNVDAGNLTEINMNENPEFLPHFGDPNVGGNAEINWYMNYITYEEGLEKLSPAWMGYFDGWYVALNGTITLDRQAAKAVLGVTDAQFDGFSDWWIDNGSEIASDWENWIIDEAGPDRLDIFWMYEYPLTFAYFEIDAEKVGDEVVLTMDTISWGAEALMTRWLHESFMPTEWYFEDMSLNARIGPETTNLTLDAAVQYAVYAYETTLEADPCWVWEAMMQDYVLSGMPPIENKSLYDRYWNWDSFGMLEYYNAAPGSAWYDEMMDYDYTPGAWNLSAGETLTIEWPAGEQLFIVHDPGAPDGEFLNYSLIQDVSEVWDEMTVKYAEPMPSDASEFISIDTNARQIVYTGPFDMWTWSNEQTAHEWLADEWDRLGVLPYGMPFVEFSPANTPPVASFEFEPPSGTTDTVFMFNASSSWDAQDSVELLEVRWDFDDDGEWDTDWSTEKVVYHQYSSPGEYTVGLEVRDTKGLTNTTSMEIVVMEVIPEFGSVLVPVLSLLLSMAFITLRRRKAKQ